MEKTRANKKADAALEVLLEILKDADDLDSENKVLRKNLLKILNTIGGQCETIFQLLFFEKPPIQDHTALAKRLNEMGYKITPKVIPATIARCKKRIREGLNEKPNSLFEE